MAKTPRKKVPLPPASDGHHATGFRWGNMDVSRTCVVMKGNEERGRIVVVRTPRRELEVYVTPTGLIRPTLRENRTGWQPAPRKDPRQLSFPWADTPRKEGDGLTPTEEATL